MKRLSRDNIEIIANRVFKAYKALPDIKNSECYRIEPEKLILEVLGLNIGIEHLSLTGDTLGLTTFREMGVEVYDETDEPFIYFLDGKTILVEKSLKQDITKIGRYNFSLMHEAAHQIFKMLFPKDYGIPSRERSLGLGKTDSYWLIHKEQFETRIVAGKMRVMIESFEKWYARRRK